MIASEGDTVKVDCIGVRFCYLFRAMGFFGPRRPLDRDELDWQAASFKWLLDQFGGIDAHRARICVNPLGEYFADSSQSGAARGREIFDEVKQLAGMRDWPTRLAPRQPPKSSFQVNQFTFVQAEGTGAAGTFQLLNDATSGWFAEIRYDVGLVNDPEALVATFAHELGHYLLSTAQRAFPGGEELHELLTDLTAVFMGFGIFLANSARDYNAQQLDGGSHMWQTRRQGYLSERALVTALVFSELLANRDPNAARPFLKPYLQSDLDLATRWFAKNDVGSLLAAVNLADYSV